MRVGDVVASMTMARVLDGVWLPSRISMNVELAVAVGAYTGRYERTFNNYKKAEVGARIRIAGSGAPMTRLAAALALALLALAGTAAAQSEPAQAGRLAEIRIHGNHTTPDDDVLKILGLTIGQMVEDAAIEAAAERLRKSGLFEQVEVRKRYRSLEPGGDIALVVVVQEFPLPDAAIPGPAILKPIKRLWNSGMFLPILRYDDGYGFTYGARISAVDWPARGNRFSVPLSWGGTKRAALEYERTRSTGPFDRIFATASVSRRTNPFYEIDEEREEVSGGRVEADRPARARRRPRRATPT